MILMFSLFDCYFSVFNFFTIFSFSVCSFKITGDSFCKVFLDLKSIFCSGRTEEGSSIPSSTLYMGLSVLLFGFGIGLVGNWVGRGGG